MNEICVIKVFRVSRKRQTGTKQTGSMEAPLIIGSLAFITTAINLLFEFPVQTMETFKSKVPASLLLGLKLTSLLMYACWAAYVWAKGDILILFGQGLALISSMLIVGQMLWLRGRKPLEQQPGNI